MSNFPSQTLFTEWNLHDELNQHACLTELKVCELTSLSMAAIRRLIREKKFPPPRRYRDIRRKFWIAREVLDWLKQQQAQQGGEL